MGIAAVLAEYVVLTNISEEISTSAPFFARQPAVKQLVATVDTTNWKTYQNTEYGYEVKYPQSLQVSGTGKEIFIDDPSAREPITEYGYRRVVAVVVKEDATSLDDWFEANISKSYRDAGISAEKKRITINGINGLSLPPTVSSRGCTQGWLLTANQKIYEISRMADTCDIRNEIIESIVSSFKII